jgi:hypothetical protein
VDLFSRKAKFHEVVKDKEALQFHAVKYQHGSRYPLALQSFQYLQQQVLKKAKR